MASEGMGVMASADSKAQKPSRASFSRGLLVVTALLLSVSCEERGTTDSDSAGKTAQQARQLPATSGAQAEPAPDPTAEPKGPSSEQVTSLYEALARTFTDHAGSNCTQLTRALGSFVDSQSAQLTNVRDEHFAAIESEPERAERLHVAMEAVMTGSMRCRSDVDMQAIKARLSTLRGSPGATTPNAP